MVALGANTKESAAPLIPLTKYSVTNRSALSRDSTCDPKKYRPIMLNRMCMNDRGSCRNMWVTSVHGRWSTSRGTNHKASVTPRTVSWRKYIAAFAMISRLTQGVIGSLESAGGTQRVGDQCARSPTLGPSVEPATRACQRRGGGGALVCGGGGPPKQDTPPPPAPS